MTPKRRAAIYKQDEEYRIALSSLGSDRGIEQITNSVQELFDRLFEQSDSCGLKAEQTTVVPRDIDNSFTISSERAALVVTWHHRYANTLDDRGLYIVEYKQQLLLPSEMAGRHYWTPPEPVKRHKVMPTLSRAMQYGWKGLEQEFVSSPRLAELVIVMLYDRMDKVALTGR